MNVAIIEIEIAYAEYMKRMVERWAETKNGVYISVFLNGIDFFRKWNSDAIEYDIIFLDAALGEVDGIEIAGKLRTMGFENTIVFTAFLENRAIDGYTVNAYRYLLKPIQQSSIDECMNYVLNKSLSRYFQYRYHGVAGRIPFADIVYFESMQHYIYIHTMEKKICMKGVLKEILQQCPASFIRCQRSYIVNVDYIQEKQGNKLKLKNNEIVDIAPRYLEIISKILRSSRYG